MTPVYAPFNIHFNAVEIKNEIIEKIYPNTPKTSVPIFTTENISDNLKQSSVLRKSLQMNIINETDLNDITYSVWNKKTNQRDIIEKSIGSFRTMNLTWCKENEETKWHNSIVIDTVQYHCRNYYDKEWIWRDDLHIPKIQELVKSLPFEYITQVWFIALPLNSIGLCHTDNSNQNYFENNNGAISFLISDGNAGLKFEKDNQLYTIADKPSVFHFNDSYLHGVTKVTSEPRYTIRVFGKINKNNYINLMNLDKAIF